MNKQKKLTINGILAYLALSFGIAGCVSPEMTVGEHLLVVFFGFITSLNFLVCETKDVYYIRWRSVDTILGLGPIFVALPHVFMIQNILFTNYWLSIVCAFFCWWLLFNFILFRSAETT